MWLDMRNLQFSKAVSSKYVIEITGIKYGMENYVITKPSVRPRIKLWKIRKCLIIGLEEYDIQ